MQCTIQNSIILISTGENLFDTAVRETREETGVDTEPVALLCFRHMHSYRWNCSDLYFACLLRPLTSDINYDNKEIAACKWIDVSVRENVFSVPFQFVIIFLQLQTYVDDPATLTSNRLIAQSYLDCKKRGCAWQPTFHSHYFPGRPDLVSYIPHALPPLPAAATTHKEGVTSSREDAPSDDSSTPKSNI